jgi:RHH-type proline utilization regulon transcriptional repressor/proline dehydrogenase/delta 1-pyrroline-5-carboxylate dehydrogenase
MSSTPVQKLERGALHDAISRAYRRDEAECVATLATGLEGARADPARIRERARGLVAAVRRQRRGASGVDHLMQEFSLSSQEGVALMCLAEALLRIPDSDTADRLIRDKISKGDWRSHLGGSSSVFVNAATWGLMITGKLVSTHSEDALGGAVTRLIARGGEPLIRRGVDFAMRLLGKQFVMGETIEDALDRSRANEARGYLHSFDMLGEAATTAQDAARYLASYEHAIHAIGRASAGRGPYLGPGISIKLSALHPRYSRAQRERVHAELLPRVAALAKLARGYDIGINIDAEEADRLEISLELLEALAADPALAGWNGLGFVVQAYQKRCPFVIDLIVDLARRNHRRIMVRLVKGAYWDTEIKRAQVEGHEDYPVFTRKVHTDLSYLACARCLLDAPDAIYPQFATHNAHTLATVYQMAADRGVEHYEFQCLHGMGEALYDNVVGAGELGKPARIYAPVGTHETLLPYLVRRLLENGANSSFVNRIVDESVTIDELVADPLDTVKREGGGRHPGIPLPRELFGAARVNSAGLDLSDELGLERLERALGELASRRWSAHPVIAGVEARSAPAIPIRNPANHADEVGSVCEATVEEARAAVDAAAAFADEWNAVPREDRAAMLERAADLLEAHRPELVSLAVREAGKTWPNAIAEVREAVDFCRYYAEQVRAAPDAVLSAPGPAVAISPWNFPLAIFMGEVTAALAAGSPVIAKPAEQTPLIAARAVELLHEAGVPRRALQFLPGRGETVGAALTADPRVRGVVFTGSTEVARLISKAVGARDARLIAETGGQNAMIVDSSALAEQVVQDVLASGFDSAGQRCSALRVLCLQQDIADRVLEMLKGAMRELAIGDPGLLATDVGPVIDDEARAGLERHIAAMRAAGKEVFQLPAPAAAARGTFVPPALIGIDSIAELEREVFGPVVHVLRFEAGQLAELVRAINDTGYGLTFGLHTRIDETVEEVVALARAGNVYVNRNMVGAVVGVQPFGGEGKSGTGPKAGGPLYLHRLRDTENVAPAAIGAHRDGSHAGALEPLRELNQWAKREGLGAVAQTCDEYESLSPLQHRVDLPGPTGEKNTLRFAERGNVLCVAGDDAALLQQIAAVLATGNVALLRAPLERLPPAVASRVRIACDQDEISAALFDGDRETRAHLHEELWRRDGALVPLITRGATTGRYPLYRLCVERVVSVNTTAAGGNTTLMTLG